MVSPISNETSNPKAYIHLIGQAGAGKTTVADYLREKYSFSIFRPSDIVRIYAKQQGIVLKSREDYILCHRQMYEENPEVMTGAVIGMEGERICIDGLRAPVEVEVLRHQCNMVTVALVCPPWLRFERIMAERLNRIGRDASSITTFEAFLEDERADNASTDSRDPNVSTVLAMADFTIDTSVNTRKVLEHIDRVLQSLL